MGRSISQSRYQLRMLLSVALASGWDAADDF
jgi:hypothetical protein